MEGDGERINLSLLEVFFTSTQSHRSRAAPTSMELHRIVYVYYNYRLILTHIEIYMKYTVITIRTDVTCIDLY